jgi:hypothetical protein
MTVPTRRATLQRRIRLLVAATIFYNVIEAIVALAEGTRVSSSALVGFGLDCRRDLVGRSGRVAVLGQRSRDAGEDSAAVRRDVVLRTRRVRRC